MRDGVPLAAIAGLGVHFTLMAIMVSLFFPDRKPGRAFVRRQWLLSGPLYGILIYLVMYWIVVPTRFGTTPKTDLWSVGNALGRIVCVGLPMAFIASRMIGHSPSGTSQVSLESASPEIP